MSSKHFFLLILAIEKIKEAKKGGGAEYIIDCFVFDDYQQHQFLPEWLDHLYIQTPSPPCNWELYSCFTVYLSIIWFL